MLSEVIQKMTLDTGELTSVTGTCCLGSGVEPCITPAILKGATAVI